MGVGAVLFFSTNLKICSEPETWMENLITCVKEVQLTRAREKLMSVDQCFLTDSSGVRHCACNKALINVIFYVISVSFKYSNL